MSKQYWVVTRPKRKLIIVPEMLKVFATVAVGKKWRGNRDLQMEFERQLVKFEWKAQNLSRDASGARTYAALLGMLGLWCEGQSGVELTQAGKEIVSGEPTVPQLTKQLINLQYPSPYSKTSTVRVDDSFKIQPHRFVIQLLQTDKLDSVTEDELAYCVVPYAKNQNDIESCIDRIEEFRLNPDVVKINAEHASGTSLDNLKNIANTVINQLEYTGFFKYRDENNAPLEFEADGLVKSKSFIEKYGRGVANYTDDEVLFQKRYGSGINKTKDYSDTNPVQPTTNPTDRLVLINYYELAQSRPIFGVSDELIDEISRKSGVNPRQVSSVLAKIANQPLLDNFEERYINLSKGGTETATEFEKVTASVFSKDGFGLDSEWVGSRGAIPDIFVYIDKKNKIHGIVDTKAYKVYKLDIDQRNKMAHTYIPGYKNINHEGETYSLGFFAYIAGGFGANIQRNFDKLKADTGTAKGCYITSYDFMQLLRKHKATPFTISRLLEIFTIDKQVIYDEVA